MTKPAEVLKTEIADFERQQAEAQQQLSVWRDKLLMANAAIQTCQALILKFEQQPTEQEQRPRRR